MLIFVLGVFVCAVCLYSLWRERRVEAPLRLREFFSSAAHTSSLANSLSAIEQVFSRGSENFSNSFITRYNNARPAVMSDVHFRHKMFPIWDEKKLCLPLDFLTKNAYYLSVGFNSLFFQFCPPEDTELALMSKNFQIFLGNAQKRCISAMKTTKTVMITEALLL